LSKAWIYNVIFSFHLFYFLFLIISGIVIFFLEFILIFIIIVISLIILRINLSPLSPSRKDIIFSTLIFIFIIAVIYRWSNSAINNFNTLLSIIIINNYKFLRCRCCLLSLWLILLFNYFIFFIYFFYRYFDILLLIVIIYLI